LRPDRVAGWGERRIQKFALGEFSVDEAQEPIAARTILSEFTWGHIRTYDEHVLVQQSRHVLADNDVFWIHVLTMSGEAIV
jgi:hypothetical protein